MQGRDGPHGFVAFFAYMGPRPSAGHSIDRYPNNDGNYEPGNCRWATRTQQNQNSRNAIQVSFNGKTQTVSEWAREIGCKEMSLLNRINRGMPVDRAITEPFDDFVNVRRRNNEFETVTFAGETLTHWQWSERTGIGRTVIQERIKRGWSPEKALTTPARKYRQK